MKHWYLIYDDNCAICNTGVGQIRRLDKTGLVKLVPLSNPQLPADMPVPSVEQMQKQMHLIAPDNTVYTGADAVARVAEIFPQSKFFGRIISLPLIRQIARLVYGIIARNRMKLSKTAA